MDASEGIEIEERARGPASVSSASTSTSTTTISASPSKTRAGIDARLLARLARTRQPLLLTGETGVGKEVLARDIHCDRGSFVPVNCGAIPAGLIESTLFGSEKAAFTGASHQRVGVFEAAGEGTLFLDEIGELPLAAQVALLRVLNDGHVVRVGGVRELPVRARVIAATHRDLDAMVRTGAFRADLLFRLRICHVHVAPLRERRDEIERLTQHFLRDIAERERRGALSLAPCARDALRGYRWPGNVRELKNALEWAVIVADGPDVTSADLPDHVRIRLAKSDKSADASSSTSDSDDAGALDQDPAPFVPSKRSTSLRALVTAYERALIEAALARHDGNQTLAARDLQLPLRTLAYKIRALAIGARRRVVVDDQPRP